jgi:hypothetical protein
VGRYGRSPLGAPFIKTAARQLAPSGYASRPHGVGLGHMLKTVEDVYSRRGECGLVEQIFLWVPAFPLTSADQENAGSQDNSLTLATESRKVNLKAAALKLPGSWPRHSFCLVQPRTISAAPQPHGQSSPTGASSAYAGLRLAAKGGFAGTTSRRASESFKVRNPEQ